jgi:cell division protease FtsH
VSDNNRPDRKGPEQGPPKFTFNNRIALVSLLVLVVIFVMFFVYSDRGTGQEIAYSVFLNYLDQGMIESVKIVDQFEIQGSFRGQSGEIGVFKTTIPYPDPNLMDKLIAKGVRVTGGPKGMSPFGVLLQALPWVIGFAFIWFLFRQVQGSGSRAFNFGKSRAKQYLDTGKRMSFQDVAGQDEAKYELQEVVEFLKNPQKFSKLGAKIPKGVLLVGLPGTGKTLMAKAIAGEAGVSFFHMSGSDFVEMFVGVGASRVRDLFEQGRKHAPCILFIDELDAVGRVRGAGYGGGHDEREQTLNQMLVEMDGFDTKDGVIIVAATNRPDVLDPALLRPGRFDRQVILDRPDLRGRVAILKVHTKGKPLDKSVDIENLARQSPGFSGADLANLVNEAAILAARRNRKVVTQPDFTESLERIVAGPERKSRIISDAEKRIIAIHEGGHAIVQRVLPKCDPVQKVTIISRGMALGYTMALPVEDRYLQSKTEFEDKIAGLLGGNAAERLIFGDTTTGASNDIEKATDLARRMVTEWGMSDKLGPLAFGKRDELVFLGREIGEQRNYSDDVARLIDEEIRTIVEAGYKRATGVLTEHRARLMALADKLIAEETVEAEELEKLFADLPPKENQHGISAVSSTGHTAEETPSPSAAPSATPSPKPSPS